MSETRPFRYGPEESAGTVVGARADARAIFAQAMFLVAVTLGFTAAGAWVGRDLSTGWALGAWIGALALVIAISFTRRAHGTSSLAMGLLFGVGLLMGLAIGPTLNAYASLEDGGTLIAQAAGLTAVFVTGLGTVGYLTKRDLSWLGRVSFFGLLGLLVFGLVAIFLTIPGERLIWCVLGLVVFAGYTVFDFWRLRRAGQDQVALVALGIFLDILNVFLFMLTLLGGGRD